MSPVEHQFAALILEARHRHQRPNINLKSLTSALLISAAAVLLGIHGLGASPLQNDYIVGALPFVAFFPAITLASYLCARWGEWCAETGAWLVASISIVAEAIAVPPPWSLLVSPEYLLWFGEVSLALMIVAATTSCRRSKPHSSDKGISKRQRFFVARDRRSLGPPIGEDIVKGSGGLGYPAASLVYSARYLLFGHDHRSR